MGKALHLLMITFGLAAFTPAYTQFDIAGTWQGTAGGETYIMQLDEDGQATLTYGKKKRKMGGKDYTMGGEKASVTYAVNMEQEPYTLSFTLHRHSTKDDVPMYSLAFKILDDNSIIAVVSDGTTPDFNSKEAVVYKRK